MPATKGKTCKAKSKTTGEQCKQAAIPGGEVCVYHGGKAPQVQEAAARRLLAMADPALSALADIVSNPDEKLTPSRLAAAKDILDRIGMGATQKIENEVSVVGSDELAALLLKYAESGGFVAKGKTPQ